MLLLLLTFTSFHFVRTYVNQPFWSIFISYSVMCYLFGTGEYHESVGLIFTQAAQDGVYYMANQMSEILLYQMNGLWTKYIHWRDIVAQCNNQGLRWYGKILPQANSC